jgi:hypothetical protein
VSKVGTQDFGRKMGRGFDEYKERGIQLIAGIILYDAYILLWRLSQDAIAKTCGIASTERKRSVANNLEIVIADFGNSLRR